MPEPTTLDWGAFHRMYDQLSRESSFDTGTGTTTATTYPTLTGTYREPDTWRMGPTVNPFPNAWDINPLVGTGRYREPRPSYEVFQDPLGMVATIKIKNVGSFKVSLNELVDTPMEDVIRGLIKYGRKTQVVLLGVVSV